MADPRVDSIAENPYLKLIARIAMVFATFIAAPVIYWLITTMILVNNTMSTIALLQTTQQTQVQKLSDTQSTIIGTQATEAQTRAVTDAQLQEQVQNVKETQVRTDAQLERSNERLDGLARLVRQQ